MCIIIEFYCRIIEFYLRVTSIYDQTGQLQYNFPDGLA